MNTLLDVVEAAAAFGGGFNFVGDDGQERFASFEKLLARARCVAGGLEALGVGAGERIGLILPSSEDFLVGALGAVSAGCAVVPLYPPLHARHLEGFSDATAHALSSLDVRAVVTSAAIRRVLGTVQARATATCHVVTLDSLVEPGVAARRTSLICKTTRRAARC